MQISIRETRKYEKGKFIRTYFYVKIYCKKYSRQKEYEKCGHKYSDFKMIYSPNQEYRNIKEYRSKRKTLRRRILNQ